MIVRQILYLEILALSLVSGAFAVPARAGLVNVGGEGQLAKILQYRGGHQMCLDVIGAQRGGGAGIEQHKSLVGLIVQGRGEGEKHLGQTIAGAAGDVEIHRLALDQPGAQRGHALIGAGTKGLVDQGHGLRVTFQLAEDLHMGKDGAAQLHGGGGTRIG